MEQIETAAGSTAVAEAPPRSAAPDAASSSDPTPAQQSPSGATPKIPSWDEAFAPREKQPPAAVKGEGASASASQPAPEAKADAASESAATTEEPAPASERDAAAVKSDGQPGTDRPRRESNRERAEREKQELTDQINQVIAERDALQKADQDRIAAESVQRAGYDEAIGPDAEFERLTYLNNTLQTLTADEYDKLTRWTTTRNYRRYFEQDAESKANTELEKRVETASRKINAQDQAFRQGIADRASRLATLAGVDAGVFSGPNASDDFEVIGRHLHAAGAASRDAEVKELKDTLSQRDARIRELETVATTRRPIPAGGASGTGKTAAFDPKASAADNWERAGFH